jgi:hypothetical protein
MKSTYNLSFLNKDKIVLEEDRLILVKK